MKYLCIDYGQARTGVAVSDAEGRMAFPRCTLVRGPQTPRRAFWEGLLACLATEAPGALVVGLPLHEDGGDSLTTRQVRNFAASLQRRCSLPVYLMPELLSSQAAQSDLAACGLAPRKHKAVLDQQAAVRILESFLADPERERYRAASPPFAACPPSLPRVSVMEDTP